MKNFIDILFVIPTLNSHELLPNLIDSIKRQTYKNWRVLFVDGGSEDDHIKFINKICSKDSRFDWCKQNSDQRGIYGAMNMGFQRAKRDEFIFFWGSDDFASNHLILEKINNFLSDNYIEIGKLLPHLLICKAQYFNDPSKINGRYSYFNRRQTIYSKNYFRRKLFLGYSPPHQGTLFCPSGISLLNKYSLKYKLAADLVYFLNFSNKKSILVQCINLNIVNIASGGVSGKENKLRIFEVLKAYKDAFGIFFMVPFVLRFIRRFVNLVIRI